MFSPFSPPILDSPAAADLPDPLDPSANDGSSQHQGSSNAASAAHGMLDDSMEEFDHIQDSQGIDGIEATQIMTQESVRKRDKKKNKKATDAAQKAVKRHTESQDERTKRLKLMAEGAALHRFQETEKEKSARKRKDKETTSSTRSMESDEIGDARRKDMATHAASRRRSETPEAEERRKMTDAQDHAERRKQQSPEEHSQRRKIDAERTARRRSEEPDNVKHQRIRDNTVRTATTRASESVTQTLARRSADRSRKAARPSAHLGIAASDVHPDAHYFGRMDKKCGHCGALYFQEEATTKREYTACCITGAVKLEIKRTFPSALMKLFMQTDAESKDFKQNIRQYNNSLAMACLMASIQVPEGRGPYSLKLHKQVYHLIGDLHPAQGVKESFAQIFIIDTEQAAAELAGRELNEHCSEALFKKLIDILKLRHPHAKSFKMMFEVEKEEKKKAQLEKRVERTVKMMFQIRSQDDHRRYQNSTANEVAVVYVGDEDEIPGERAMTVHQRSGELQTVNALDRNCDPMAYPLFFPTGQFGWHVNIPYTRARGKREKVTMREFYAYNIHVRSTFSPLFRAGKLFQQYVVDVWTRVEQNRLTFIRFNQALLRSESYNGLQDYVAGQEKGPVGTRILLPASHTGSPRDMVQQYQDAMAVVSKYGKPDYFLTMTCNAKWKEIQECLLGGQEATDRPDVVARVFKMKVDELRVDLFKRNILGEVLAYIYVIEFQKRGLPHVHMLMIMKPGSKPRTAADVDRIISAEIPDKNKFPRLHDLVTSMMMHRPCGVHDPSSPCMRNGCCDKKFPKGFRDTTSTDHDGFSLYRRRDDGRFVESKVRRQTHRLTNQHVVPYNAYLLEKYECHINLEVCGAISSVKYLYKYVYKGTTRASMVMCIDEHGNEYIDEIKQYLDTRFVCAPEAVHHLLKFPMSYRSVKVLQLSLHLPSEQQVIFQRGNEADALARAETKNTKLTAWFEVNKKSKEAVLPDGSFPPDLRDSRQYFYHEMPEHFTFNTSSNSWSSRKTKEFAIGRMFFVSPRNREKFALRQLLLYTKGATSFEDLRTVEGHQWPTFVEAARAAGYLADDTVYEQTLQEAAGFHYPSQLRGLFVTLLLFETINNAELLWDKFKNHFSEDFVHRCFSDEEAESMAYFDIMDRMEAMNEDLRKWIDRPYKRVHQLGQEIDFDQCKEQGEEMKSKLNSEQSEAIEEILKALGGRGGLFFIDGPGGSGKTFLYNCLANIIMGMRLKILCIAWTGIAASLLPNGRTVASICKLDIMNGCRSSRLNLRSALAKLLSELDIVLWDEAPMSPKDALETVDKLFREITGIDLPFGGKVVVLGGDFRQVLPVVEKRGVDEQIANCIKKSYLWKQFQTFHLKTNMRLSGSALQWKEELLSIGDGKVGAPVTGEMAIPDGLESRGDLTDEVFGDLLASGDVEKLAKVAILTPRNKEALEMNNAVLDKMPGYMRVYTSLDEIVKKEGDDGSDNSLNFPTEFLNRMTPSGMPPHELRIKKGAIIMLLRNLDVKNSLCNGTRFIVEDMGARVLQCKFVSGARQGQSVLLPRIKLNYEQNLPFVMSRLQFPVRLSFAMTINKSQGQTFEKIGLQLDEPIFSHGQLYVALSRTTSKEGIKVDSSSGFVNNVVYEEVLN